MALMEEYIPGRNENLHDYLIPTIGDVPEVVSILVESGDPVGPYGAKGIGEHALVPTAPAILNAIRDAVGAGVRRLPGHARPRARRDRGRAARDDAEPATDTVVCDACPIRCVIKPGRTGACDRYGNVDGVLVAHRPDDGAAAHAGTGRRAGAVRVARGRLGGRAGPDAEICS